MGLACLNVTDTVSANLSICLSPHTLLCTSTKCQHEQLPWQRLPPFPATLTLFWSKQCSTSITPTHPLLFSLPLSFLSSLLSPGVQVLRNIFLALFHVTLVANRSQSHFCPWVSCVTCPLHYFPLLATLTVSVGLPEQSGYHADPQILRYTRALQPHPVSCMKV